MKPTNTRPDLLLPDGEPVRCRFFVWGEKGSTNECEANATVLLSDEERQLFHAWTRFHPKAIIGVWPGHVHLCDTHETHVRECIEAMR